MKLRVNKNKPLYRLNVYINRDVANKARSCAVLEDKTIERYVEDVLKEKTSVDARISQKSKKRTELLKQL